MLSASVILARNNVNILGSGSPTLVFAHGFGCDQNMWRFIITAFKDRYRIVLFDYVGAGKSDISFYNKERYADLNGYAEDVLEIMNALELSNAVFIGHSVSGMIGMLAALKQPNLFSHLVLVGPSPCYINSPGYVGGFEREDIQELLVTMEKNYIGWANFLAPAIMKNPAHPELVQELTESFCSTDPIIARQFAEATFFSDNRNDLPKLKTPCLILQCSDDLIAPLSIGEFLHSQISNSTLKVLKATGHCPHMSAPEETIEAIQGYFAEMKI